VRTDTCTAIDKKFGTTDGAAIGNLIQKSYGVYNQCQELGEVGNLVDTVMAAEATRQLIEWGEATFDGVDGALGDGSE